MKKSTIKNILIIGGIIIVLLVLYVVFLKPSPADTQSGTLRSSTGATQPAATTSGTTQASGSTAELLSILTSLQSLELNDSILFNPAFDALQDISMPLMREGNQGRRNPFAPLGSDPVIIDITPTTSQSAEEDALDSEDSETTEAAGGQDIFGLPAGN